MEGCRDTAVGSVTLQPSFPRFSDYYLALVAPAGVRALGQGLTELLGGEPSP